jgi:hypothetical protein
MARRRYGSGSIVHRAERRWEGRLWRADGSRRFVHASDRRRVITRLQEERRRLASGIPLPARGLIVRDYLEQWLEVMRSRLRPRTLEMCLVCRCASS